MKFLLTFATFCLGCSLFAAASDWMPRPRKGCSKITVDNGITTVSGPETQAWTKQSYPARKGISYRIRGDFRASAPGKSFYLGIQCLDKNGKALQGNNTLPVPGSDTVLLAPVKNGDRSILVKDASRWRKQGGTFAAFAGKKDYSDLPNSNLSHAPVVHIEKENNGWRITFRHGMRKEYKAGTAVRQHQGGMAYIYVASGLKLTKNWLAADKTLKVQWHDPAVTYDQKKNLLLPGTVSFRVVTLIPGRGTALEIKNMNIQKQ